MTAILISGLEPIMLKNCPTTKESLNWIVQFIDLPNSLLIAHNGTRFDNNILYYWMNEYKVITKNNVKCMDSLDICKKVAEKMPRKGNKLVYTFNKIRWKTTVEHNCYL